jgi:hypothetical protein
VNPEDSLSQTPPVTFFSGEDRDAERAIAALRREMEVVAFQPGENGGSVKGMILEPLAEHTRAIRELLESLGYAAILSKTGEPAPAVHLVRFLRAATGPAKKNNPTVNIILLVLTIFTTLTIGSLQAGGNVFFLRDLATDPLTQSNFWHILWRSFASANPLNLGELARGIPFSFALILILGSHELGHYLTARRYGVDATLPYFLPIPHPLIGTMGAFIRIKSPIPDRRALIRLGAAGPLVGFALAVPVVIVGMMLSKPVLVDQSPGSIALGSSLLFGLLSQLFFPHLPTGYDVSLHPLAFAGWLGFFVTALNLLPLGQLDGGHIAYVALGRWRRGFRIAVLAVMLGLGFLWPGWFFWAMLVLILGLGHPPTMDEVTPITRTDRILIAAAIAVLVLTFIPNPFPAARI